MKKDKGQFGYRSYYKKRQLIFIVLGTLAILIQLFARELTTNQSAKNILTVMAILSVLPTANLLSPLLATWKYKTPPVDFYERTKKYDRQAVLLYDLIITSKEQILPFDIIAVQQKSIYAYCSRKKADQKKAKQLIQEMFQKHGIRLGFKLYLDEAEWTRQVNGLSDFTEENISQVEDAVRLLKSISV